MANQYDIGGPCSPSMTYPDPFNPPGLGEPPVGKPVEGFPNPDYDPTDPDPNNPDNPKFLRDPALPPVGVPGVVPPGELPDVGELIPTIRGGQGMEAYKHPSWPKPVPGTLAGDAAKPLWPTVIPKKSVFDEPTEGGCGLNAMDDSCDPCGDNIQYGHKTFIGECPYHPGTFYDVRCGGQMYTEAPEDKWVIAGDRNVTVGGDLIERVGGKRRIIGDLVVTGNVTTRTMTVLDKLTVTNLDVPGTLTAGVIDAGSVTANSVGDREGTLDNLRDSVTTFQQTITGVQQSLAALSGTVSSADSNLQAQITALQGAAAASTAAADIAAIAARVTALEGLVATMQTNIATMQGQIATLQAATPPVTIVGCRIGLSDGSGYPSDATTMQTGGELKQLYVWNVLSDGTTVAPTTMNWSVTEGLVVWAGGTASQMLTIGGNGLVYGGTVQTVSVEVDSVGNFAYLSVTMVAV